MMRNPFNPQFPISPELFYGRKKIIERYKYNVEQSKKGSLTNMGVIGELAIGKTSLLLKLHSVDDYKQIPKVVITLKDTYVNTFEDVIAYIYHSLGNALKKFIKNLDLKISISYVEINSDTKLSKDKFREYLNKIWVEISKKSPLIIVFIDDFHLADKHFMDIRNCFQELQKDGCKYMLVVSMIPDPLKYGKREESFKRFFDWNWVEEFSKEETFLMIKYILEESGVNINISSKVLEDIFNKTLGHPYYVTIILNEILRHKNSGKIIEGDYNKIRPFIDGSLRTTFGEFYSDLSWNEEEALKNIITSKQEVFSPSVSGQSSASNTFKNLEEKDVIIKIRYGEYKFKHPLIKSYFDDIYLDITYDTNEA